MKYLPIALIFYLIPTISWACDCSWLKAVPENIQRQYEHADKVFIGSLIKLDQRGSYAFAVHMDLKGTQVGDTLVGSYNTSCSARPRELGLWLVYATDYYGRIDISMCSFSRNLTADRFLHLDQSVPDSVYDQNSKEAIYNSLLHIEILKTIRDSTQARSDAIWYRAEIVPYAILIACIALVFSLIAILKAKN